MAFELTLITSLNEEGSITLEANMLAEQILAEMEGSSLQAKLRFNDTAGRFQLLLGDPTDPFLLLNYPTDLSQEGAITLSTATLQIVVNTISPSATVVQIDAETGGFIYTYS